MKRETDESRRVIACVIRKGEEVLLCRRPLEKHHGGLWEFPGGKCEAGESDKDTVHRELREELGVQSIDYTGSPLFTHCDPGSRFVIAFVPVTFSDNPRAIEHSEIRWLTYNEIASLELAPSDAAFIRFMDASKWQFPEEENNASSGS
jgi:8-oxo-dGTP diphosphatase